MARVSSLAECVYARLCARVCVYFCVTSGQQQSWPRQQMDLQGRPQQQRRRLRGPQQRRHPTAAGWQPSMPLPAPRRWLQLQHPPRPPACPPQSLTSTTSTASSCPATRRAQPVLPSWRFCSRGQCQVCEPGGPVYDRQPHYIIMGCT